MATPKFDGFVRVTDFAGMNQQVSLGQQFGATVSNDGYGPYGFRMTMPDGEVLFTALDYGEGPYRWSLRFNRKFYPAHA